MDSSKALEILRSALKEQNQEKSPKPSPNKEAQKSDRNWRSSGVPSRSITGKNLLSPPLTRRHKTLTGKPSNLPQGLKEWKIHLTRGL
jgi:hypothetical protein